MSSLELLDLLSWYSISCFWLLIPITPILMAWTLFSIATSTSYRSSVSFLVMRRYISYSSSDICILASSLACSSRSTFISFFVFLRSVVFLMLFYLCSRFVNCSSSRAYSASFSSSVFYSYFFSVPGFTLVPSDCLIVLRRTESELQEDSYEDERLELFLLCCFLMIAVRRVGLLSITGVALLSSVRSGIAGWSFSDWTSIRTGLADLNPLYRGPFYSNRFESNKFGLSRGEEPVKPTTSDWNCLAS